MILPKSKLPFKEKLSKNKKKYQILDGNNNILIDNVNSLQDAMYIEDACNNYTKAVKLLKKILSNEIDLHEIDENELLNWLKLCIGFNPIIIKTKNGYHVLIETILLTESFKNKWFNNLNNNLPISFDKTMNGDNLCVIPGTIQANFEPYIIK